MFYLPGACTHTDTERKHRKAGVRNILKSSEKTQYLMEHPVSAIDSTENNQLIGQGTWDSLYTNE